MYILWLSNANILLHFSQVARPLTTLFSQSVYHTKHHPNIQFGLQRCIILYCGVADPVQGSFKNIKNLHGLFIFSALSGSPPFHSSYTKTQVIFLDGRGSKIPAVRHQERQLYSDMLEKLTSQFTLDGGDIVTY